MPEASKNQRTTFSFQDTPPEIAYLDPSFLLNVLLEDTLFAGLSDLPAAR